MIQVSGGLLSEHINYHNKPEDAPQTDYALATYIGAQFDWPQLGNFVFINQLTQIYTYMHVCFIYI